MSTAIRVSYGTGIVLGLIKAKQDVAPTTAYLLFDQGCIGKCSFCSRANGNRRSENLSRIIWPEFVMEEVMNRLTQKPLPFKRICLQTGYNPSLENELEEIIMQIIKTGIPTSATMTPSQDTLAQRLLENGLDHVGVGLDAATPESYALHKRRDWSLDWPKLKNLMGKFPGKIEVHQIYGLGDSEQVFMQQVQAIIDAGGKVSLFAFTPVNGGTPPQISEYRRVQAFRYLCEKGLLRLENCSFRDGQLIKLGLSKSELVKSLDDGAAFRTSGCGDCNRPYYNERPGQLFFNYPRALMTSEFEQALQQLELLP